MPTNPILGKPVHDIMQVKGRTKALAVGDTPIEARYGAVAMPERKIVVLYNNGTETVEYGFEDTLVYGEGMPIPAGDQEAIGVGERVPVFVVGPTGTTTDIRMIEGY